MIEDKAFFEGFDRLAPNVTDNQSFHNPYLSVNWSMGNICTYQCSYCSKALWDGSFPWPTIEEAVKTVKVLNQVYKKPPYNKKKIIFELLGGEVTLWKDIGTLLSVIKETDNITLLITNGVRTLNWWKKHGAKFEWVSLSYNSEFADYEHLCDVSNLLTDLGVSSSILVLMYPKKWEKCVEAHKYFKENSRSSIILQRLHLISTSKDGEAMARKKEEEHQKYPYSKEEEHQKYPYSEDQLTYLSENTEFNECMNSNYDPGINFFDSKNQRQPYRVTSTLLSINNLNNWKGWDCYVGVDSLYLEQNGDVRRAVMCRVRPPMGKWRGFNRGRHQTWKESLEEIKWPTEPVLCPYTTCFCGADHKARKQKRNSNEF